ncbi:hypothetical protein BGX26_012509 [Mortierella sp. AD094]|nr:hypothetical protein BGX26_012509 [Mortierella sp. AD094]
MDKYPGSTVVRSTAKRLSVEFKQHFKAGSFLLMQKIQQDKKKGLLPENTPDTLDLDMTPIENFVTLNRASGNSRRMSPLSSPVTKFISLSELELVRVFWHEKEIKKLLTDVGSYAAGERKNMKGWARSTVRMTKDEMTDHLSMIRDPNFSVQDPDSYTARGYVLRGSIQTNGHRIKVFAFKLNELHCVKYRQLDEDKIPPRFSFSSLGGTNHYLSEIRNVVKTKEDSTNVLNCDPSEIDFVGIDLGDTFTVGPVYHNLAVKKKALYQPTLKHRRWLEQRKEREVDGKESIAHIESKLPPLHGPGASITAYNQSWNENRGELETFHKSVVLEKHQWDLTRAMEKEFQRLAERIFTLAGGSSGAKRDDANKVIIGIGLGEFSLKSGLSSFHSRFKDYFVSLARSLNNPVVGVNEYYTSKKCPVCEDFVGQIDIRRLYCRKCGAIMHRDVMAGHNMCIAMKGQVLDQKRPRSLQPIDNEGNYPWEKEEENSASIATEPSTEMSMVEQSMQEEECSESVATESKPEVSMVVWGQNLESTVERLSIKRMAPNDDQDKESSERAHKRAA